MTIRRILVALDGSDNARRALAWTIELARIVEAEVVAVHAVGLLTKTAEGETQPSAAHRGEIVELFEQTWCQPLRDAGLPVTAIARDGNPVAVVLGAATDLGADLVVLGSRGVGGLPEQLLGSTSHQVAERSSCPVVIVPPDDRT